MTSGTAADAGFATERTRLAWRRTALTATVLALLAGPRFAFATGPPYRLVALALLMLVWLALVLLVQGRIHQLATSGYRPAARTLAGLALLVVAYAILGMLLVLA